MARDRWFCKHVWLLSLALPACEAPKSAGLGAPSAQPATSATQTAPAEPPPPAPPDLDVAAQLKALKCPAKPRPGPCAVLEVMKECKRWAVDMPSGDGRWLGWGFLVTQGKEDRSPLIVKVKRTNQQDVGPGQLNFKLVLEELTKPMGMPFEQAERAIAAWERGDLPPKNNQALEYAQKTSATPDVFLTRTQGGHVYGLAHGGLFVCEQKQRLYVARKAATRSSTGDGLYAEVFPVTW